MPVINGRYYMTPAHGEALERVREADAAQNASQESANPAGANRPPSQKEIIAELNSLATSFGIPAELVLATAATESQYDTAERNDNKNSRGKVTSTDHGLMQVNSNNIGKSVSGPDGKPFPIGEEVQRDWKANAKAGVAILAEADRAAQREHPSASARQVAQEAYSRYHGGPIEKHRYNWGPRLPEDTPLFAADRNFLRNYLQEAEGK